MSGLSRRLKQLDEELLSLGEDTMLLEELDGFIAGLLACPELIMPSDWLPVVWHADDTDQQPIFENLDHANRILGLIMEHYNDVARTLMDSPQRYTNFNVERSLRKLEEFRLSSNFHLAGREIQLATAYAHAFYEKAPPVGEGDHFFWLCFKESVHGTRGTGACRASVVIT